MIRTIESVLTKWIVIIGITMLGGYWIYQILTQLQAELLAKLPI